MTSTANNIWNHQYNAKTKYIKSLSLNTNLQNGRLNILDHITFNKHGRQVISCYQHLDKKIINRVALNKVITLIAEVGKTGPQIIYGEQKIKHL